MVGHDLADGNIGLVADWGCNHADHETARSILAHLVPSSPGDRSYLGRSSSTPTSHDPTYRRASRADAAVCGDRVR